jgi:hypothetical protein
MLQRLVNTQEHSSEDAEKWSQIKIAANKLLSELRDMSSDGVDLSVRQQGVAEIVLARASFVLSSPRPLSPEALGMYVSHHTQ